MPDVEPPPPPPPPPVPEVCGVGQTTVGDECMPVGPTSCPDGFEREPLGWGCVAIAADCTSGRAEIGSTSCLPVGWSDCGDGFEIVDDACLPIVPTATCATGRDALGSRTCVTVGDCDRAFPPAGALVVQPNTSIADAIAMASAGDVVAIMDGTYAEPIVVTEDVTVEGRCAERVEVQGIRITGSSATVRGFRVRGPDLGVVVEQGAAGTIEDVVVDDVVGVGIVVEDPGTTATIRRTAVRNVEERSGEGNPFGYGLILQKASSTEIEGLSVSSARTVGVLAKDEGTSVVASNVVVRGIRTNTEGRFGEGITVWPGASLELDGAVTERTRRYGLRIRGEGASATLSRVAVLDTIVDENVAVGLMVREGAQVTAENVTVRGGGPPGVAVVGDLTHLELSAATIFGMTLDKSSGIDVRNAASALLTGVEITAIDGFGATAFGPGVELELRRSVVRRLLGRVSPSVAVEQGAYARIVESQLAENAGVGLQLFHPDTRVFVDRSIVETTRSTNELTVAPAVAVHEGASLSIQSSSVRNNADFGITVDDPGSRASLTGVTVDATTSDFDRYAGMGVLVRFGGHVAASRSTFVANRNCGVMGGLWSGIEAIGSAFVANHQENGGAFGCGMLTADSATVTASVFVSGQTAGLIVHGKGSEASVDRCRFEANDFSSGAYGHGITVDTGTITVQRSQLSGNAGVGIVLDNASAVIQSTYIASNAVGIHVQRGTELVEAREAPYRPQHGKAVVTTDCRFVDNETKVGAGSIPVPTWGGEL